MNNATRNSGEDCTYATAWTCPEPAAYEIFDPDQPGTRPIRTDHAATFRQIMETDRGPLRGLGIRTLRTTPRRGVR